MGGLDDVPGEASGGDHRCWLLPVGRQTNEQWPDGQRVDQVIGARQKPKGMRGGPTGRKALGIFKVVELNQPREQLWFPQQAAA